MQKSTKQHLLVQSLSVLSQLPLLPVCNSAAWMCVDKQTISHPQMHGNAWQMWVIFPPPNKNQNSISTTLLPSKHKNSRIVLVSI